MPTNHERLVWGLGDGSGLATIETTLGRVGGLICWENFMPLARAALYESGIDIYLAPTADDTESVARLDPAHRARVACVRPLVLRLPARVELSGRRRDRRRPRPARPRRLGDRRAERRVPRRPALGRGGAPRRRPRPGSAVRRASALRRGRPLLAARRAAPPSHAAEVTRHRPPRASSLRRTR